MPRGSGRRRWSLAARTRAGWYVAPGLVTGICGEHGGDPDSIELAHRIGLAHVSCSPARVEVARLAAAHAALDVVGPADSA